MNCNPPDCVNESYNNGAFVFNVSHFTTFQAAEAGDCGTLTSSTTLSQNLSSTGTCLQINANDIVVSCSGYSITGAGIEQAINVSGRTNVTIRDCVLQNFTQAILVNSSNQSLFTNNTLLDNRYGMVIDPSFNNSIINNSIFDNNEIGLLLINSHNNSILNNSFTNHTFFAIALSNGSTNNNITFNAIRRTGNASILINESSNANYIINNTLFNQSLGVNIRSGVNNIIALNNFSNSTNAHANAEVGANHFNISVGIFSFSAGNFWDDITTLRIADQNNDTYGDRGFDYPYNATNGGNVTGFVQDFGPITPNFNRTPDTPILVNSTGLVYTNNTIFAFRNVTLFWNASDPDTNDNLTWEINVTALNNPFAPAFLLYSPFRNVTTPELTVDTDYFWTVRANDSISFSNVSSIGNFTLISLISINLSNRTVEFVHLFPGEINDSTDENPLPFLLENTGNIQVNITITGTQLFNRTPFPASNFSFKVRSNESGSFDFGASTTSFTNMTNVTGRRDIINLNYTDSNDTAKIDLFVAAPEDEPAGYKQSNITFEVIV